MTATAADQGNAAQPAELPPPDSPYRGLRPYTEAEAAGFFGREAEGEIVAANLLGARLTLLYGPSGVGKSSPSCSPASSAVCASAPGRTLPTTTQPASRW